MFRNSSLSTLRGATLTVAAICLLFSVMGLVKLAFDWNTLSGHKLTHSGFIVPTKPRNAAAAQRMKRVEQRMPVDEIYASLAVVTVIQLLFDLILIHGARIAKTRPATGRRCVLAWVIFRAILHTLFSLALVALMVMAHVLRNNKGEPLHRIAVWKTVLYGFVVVLCWCGWTVVAVFNRRLRDAAAEDVTYLKMPKEGKPMFSGPAEGTVAAAGMA